MQAPAVPADEGERLGELRSLGLLDTPPDPRFDRITRIASRLFDVPAALVTLVDADRQWFKSACGVSASQTGRDVSFCGHAILQDEPFIVEDTLFDPRFFDNPLVLGPPHVRFYAGQPLRGPAGHKVGTLCIVSNQARSMLDDDVQMLKDLAGWVEDEILLWSRSAAR
jgi:GAF domain-containing protein